MAETSRGREKQWPQNRSGARSSPTPYTEAAPRPHAIDSDLFSRTVEAELNFDRDELLRAHAAAAVPLYWVANAKDCAIEVYTMPTGPVENPRFESSRIFGPDNGVPVVLDGREVGKIAVEDVLF